MLKTCIYCARKWDYRIWSWMGTMCLIWKLQRDRGEDMGLRIMGKGPILSIRTWDSISLNISLYYEQKLYHCNLHFLYPYIFFSFMSCLFRPYLGSYLKDLICGFYWPRESSFRNPDAFSVSTPVTSMWLYVRYNNIVWYFG